MVKIKRGLKNGKRFILDVTRICTLAHSAASPKASKQTIQLAPAGRKTEKISKIARKWYPASQKFSNSKLTRHTG